MSNILKQKTVAALFWSASERFSQQGIQFIITIILARLLAPEEFGLIAMLTIFMAIAQSFIDSGFGQALIQKQDVTHIDECSIFYFNIFVGILAAVCLCLAAPWIAIFYNQPLLTPLTYALSLNLIINSFGLVQTTLLTRHIDFKTQLKVSMIATAISGVFGITMAYNGFGVWSLVAQSLSSNFFRTVLLWFFNTWRPSLVFSFTSLRGMFAFGSRLLAAGLLNTFFVNIYLVVIGKLFSPVSLGYYTRAKGVQQLPTCTLSVIISRVTFPVFSSMQNDKPRLKSGARKALTMLVMINFPIMIGLAIVAKPLVLVLLTEKWLPCVTYLQLLCVVGMLYPLHVINLNVLTAQGRSDLFFRLEILKKILVTLSIGITYRWGIEAMLWGQIITSIIAYYVNAYYTRKLLDYSIFEQIYDVFPCFAGACIMGLCVYTLRYIHIEDNFIFFLSQIVIGLIIYIFICYIFKISSFIEFVEMMKLKIFKNSKLVST
ncbi:lipopolysaccharide biosynthesis protein [Desulfoluna spongiiphila]|uniref:lipopolysaccharide biosynthesis protein n=1 Tax=Desulfoluna spongiiphila TaxID=419481 RepID=UPI001251C718|nr:lipopolysaccharide biosynthesis protein [Desulfoluna spongiiphila]VVS95290.1 polysaccharide biosynthesis protein [Desulfoluna spongiiphila]